MCKAVKYLSFVTLCALLFSFCAHSANISAKACVLMESQSGNIIYSKNENAPMPMASTTKIMTAVIALENIDTNKVITVPKEAVGIEGSSIYLKEGERLSASELLYALLLESANDAAVCLAIACCGDVESFVELMNLKANELGLKSTHFTNPHGLDNEEHYTTASDLAIIAKYALSNEEFAKICATYKKTIPLNNGEGTRVLINHNRLLRSYDGAVGIKTGFTKKSGRCLVSSAEKDGVKLICVTLNAPNDWQDHKALLDRGFDEYECISLADKEDYKISLEVMGGTRDFLIATNREPFSLVVKRSDYDVSAVLEYTRPLCAPIVKGQMVGKIVFYNNGERIGETELFATYDVANIKYKKSIFERLF